VSSGDSGVRAPPAGPEPGESGVRAPPAAFFGLSPGAMIGLSCDGAAVVVAMLGVSAGTPDVVASGAVVVAVDSSE